MLHLGKPFEENARQHHPPLTGGIGHRAPSGSELLARPAAKIALIGVHASLHPFNKRLAESLSANLTQVIHRSSPVR